MGVQDLAEGDELISQRDLTIADLINLFGREPVRRGLNYMEKLPTAQENYRKSASGDKMERGYREAGVRGDVSPAADEWERGMEKSGLGIDDES